ncbi:MAG: hypothetical protein FWE93_06890 [Alphaproteobacteria bacterium]|nr:hypothetical protein [Alphaproteobacteria bacterium]
MINSKMSLDTFFTEHTVDKVDYFFENNYAVLSEKSDAGKHARNRRENRIAKKTARGLSL